MTGLNFYLVSYDIADPKRLREVHRTMKGFGRGLHYSVFRCDLTHQGVVELKASLDEIINHLQDRVMIIDLGPVEGSNEKRIIFLGCHPPEMTREAVIV